MRTMELSQSRSVAARTGGAELKGEREPGIRDPGLAARYSQSHVESEPRFAIPSPSESSPGSPVPDPPVPDPHSRIPSPESHLSLPTCSLDPRIRLPHNPRMPEPLSRRRFFEQTAAALTGIAVAGCGSEAAQPQGPANANTRRVLLKGGCIISLDRRIGDFDVADVLIEGTRIVDVRPGIDVTAEIIDATNTIVMPGFVDTHRHMWQGALRSILPDGLLSDYGRDITV